MARLKLLPVYLNDLTDISDALNDTCELLIPEVIQMHKTTFKFDGLVKLQYNFQFANYIQDQIYTLDMINLTVSTMNCPLRYYDYKVTHFNYISGVDINKFKLLIRELVLALASDSIRYNIPIEVDTLCKIDWWDNEKREITTRVFKL